MHSSAAFPQARERSINSRRVQGPRGANSYRPASKINALGGGLSGCKWCARVVYLTRIEKMMQHSQYQLGGDTSVRQYEAMYIVDAELSDEQLEPIIEKYKKVVTDMGGIVHDAGKWEQGRRKLAYEIAGRQEGIYILMNFEAGPEVPKELDRMFRISDDVFRHLIVLKDKKAKRKE
jgi:small subunit ribosomal protein S6